ncbi:MAG: ABC transporter transmembrane domain-containing protein, partial [Pseudorhodoplanes sp.]
EHVLQLPLSYHGGAHSGRLMKVLLAGTDSLWNLWLSFFRDHFAAFVSLLILLPLSVFLNWRLAILLIVLCVVFAVLTAIVLRKTNDMQTAVERHYSDLAERASDALGNVALVQSYVRVEAEVSGLRNVVNRLLSAQMPVLSWWAVVAVATRASTTVTLLAIFLVGTALLFKGLATLGEIVMFMSFASMLVQRLEQAVGFVNKVFMDAPRLREFFEVLDTDPVVRDRPNAIDLGNVEGRVTFENVSFSYDGKRPAVADLDFSAQPGDVIALVGPTGAGKTTALALLHRVFDPQSGSIKIDDHDLRDIKLASLRRNIGVVFQEVLLLNRSIAENLYIGKPDATEEEMRSALARAQALDFVERNPEGMQATVGE